MWQMDVAPYSYIFSAFKGWSVSIEALLTASCGNLASRLLTAGEKKKCEVTGTMPTWNQILQPTNKVFNCLRYNSSQRKKKKHHHIPVAVSLPGFNDRQKQSAVLVLHPSMLHAAGIHCRATVDAPLWVTVHNVVLIIEKLAQIQ